MQKLLLEGVQDAIRAVDQLQSREGLSFMLRASEIITEAFRSGNKLIIAGNGGSLADAAHFAEELTGFFRCSRPALPAIALSEPGHITCTANDLGFDWVFSRGVEAYGKPGDVFIGLTTSGNSINIVNAFETARRLQLKTISFLGKGGGRLKNFADAELIIDGFDHSDRIQEAHMTAIHLIIQLVENQLYPELHSSSMDKYKIPLAAPLVQPKPKIASNVL